MSDWVYGPQACLVEIVFGMSGRQVVRSSTGGSSRFIPALADQSNQRLHKGHPSHEKDDVPCSFRLRLPRIRFIGQIRFYRSILPPHDRSRTGHNGNFRAVYDADLER